MESTVWEGIHGHEAVKQIRRGTNIAKGHMWELVPQWSAQCDLGRVTQPLQTSVSSSVKQTYHLYVAESLQRFHEMIDVKQTMPASGHIVISYNC